jgi:hypothetical protein
VDTYESTGWKRASKEKTAPKGEILASKLKIYESQRAILDVFKAIGTRMQELMRPSRVHIPIDDATHADAEFDDVNKFNVWTGKGPSTSRKEAGKFIPALRAPPRVQSHSGAGATAEGEEASPADEGMIEAEEIACSKCGSYDADDDNDILMCDYSGCGLAFHMRCCDPPVTELPAEDRDWLCTRVSYAF